VIPGVEMRVRLDDRLGAAAVTSSCSASSSDQHWRCSWSLCSPSGSVGDGCAGTSSSRLSWFALIKAPPPAHPWLTLGREPSAFSVSTP
jgi:hypothetical protein